MAPAAARSWATEAVPGLVHEDSRRVSKVVLLQRKPSHFWDLQQQQQRAVPACCACMLCQLLCAQLGDEGE